MEETKNLENKYWELYDEMSPKNQLEYIWSNWGDMFLGIVKEWDTEILVESIEELKEILESQNDNLTRNNNG